MAGVVRCVTTAAGATTRPVGFASTVGATTRPMGFASTVGHEGPPLPQVRLDVVGRQGRGEQVALCGVEAELDQVGLLLAGLDSLGDDVERQCGGQLDHRCRDRVCLGSRAELVGEAAVELELVDGIASQVGQ